MSNVPEKFILLNKCDFLRRPGKALRGVRVAWAAGLCAAASVLLGACSSSSAPEAATPAVDIQVLSNRADLLSGGDALIALQLPDGTDPATVTTQLDGQDVSSSFALRANGRVEGLLTGIADGAHTLSVRLADGRGARLSLRNYPNGGPVFAGTQVLPWQCADGAVDAQCNQPAAYTYFYQPRSGGGFQAYDPAQPPDDVATIVTDRGDSVPYIVRLETGHQDRGEYQIAVLYDPTRDWQPWAPQPGWDGKLLVTAGANCGVRHGEGASPNVLVDDALQRGFAVISTSLFDNNQNCNMVVQGEALMMLKEHFIERYGPVRYTIGMGCSGGSIAIQQNANGYPGLIDGIIPQCSFPDSLTTAREVEDCALLENYWQNLAGTSWSLAQEVAVTGHPALTTCATWVNLSKFNAVENPRLVPSSLVQNCGVTRAQAWTPLRRDGVRCTLVDYEIAVIGARAADGYANNPINNIGVQYGLGALRDGSISLAQFLDLNEKIGSHDINYDFQSERHDADDMEFFAPAAYDGGLINETSLLDTVPIIDLRGHDTVDIHLDYHSYELRARLDREHGGHDNQVIWLSPILLSGDPSWPHESLSLMDQWLSAIEADTRDLPLASKVVEDKPGAVTDRCYDAQGNILGDLSACDGVIDGPSQNPRMVGGEGLTNDNYRCQLRPLDPADYVPLTLSDSDWQRLQQIFADGVCDYSKPGLGQGATSGWRGYAGGPGGQPLGAPPGVQAL